MSAMITVGISDMNIAMNGDTLITHALGSCVGICLYDDRSKIAGMAHIMLPSSEGFQSGGRQMCKFADLAIPLLIDRMVAVGANRNRMRAKIAGGAQMFMGVNLSNLANIGERNVIATRQILREKGIPILADDTGGDYGRTQVFSSLDGSMTIRSVNRGQKTL